MQVKQSEYQFAKNLLQLFKQRSKEHPYINHNFESLILSSNLRQDYLQITDRIGLTKKDTTNNLAEVIRFAKDTAKYGLKIHYLEDVNKNLQERLRSYFVDLNKYLKEMCDTSANVWNCFKKIKNMGLAVRCQKESTNLGLGFYLTRLKQFKQDVQNNKYSVIRTNTLHKTQNISNRIEEIKSKILSIYHLLYNDTPFIVKKKELSDFQIDTVLDQIQKKVMDKSQTKQKEFYINCFVKVLQSRKILDLKLVQKEIQYATKKNQELQLKRALKLYIQDQVQREKQIPLPLSSKSSYSSLSSAPLGQNRNVLNQTFLHTDKPKQTNQSVLCQNQQLKKQISHLRQIIRTHNQNQIVYQNQLSRLKLQLENQQTKFTYFDRSDLTNLQEEDELITYHFAQEEETIHSPTENPLDSQQDIMISQVVELKEFGYPCSSNKADLMIERLKDYQHLQIKLNQQLKELDIYNNQLKIQNTHYLDQISLYKSRWEQEKHEKEGYKTNIQELLHHLQQVEKKCQLACAQIESQAYTFTAEKQAYFQRIEHLNVQNDQFNHKITGLQNMNSMLTDKIEQLGKTIDSLHLEKDVLSDEINTKTMTLQALQTASRQLYSSLQNCMEQIQTLNHRNKQLRDTIQKLESNKINQSIKKNGTFWQSLANQQQLKIDHSFFQKLINHYKQIEMQTP